MQPDNLEAEDKRAYKNAKAAMATLPEADVDELKHHADKICPSIKKLIESGQPTVAFDLGHLVAALYIQAAALKGNDK